MIIDLTVNKTFVDRLLNATPPQLHEGTPEELRELMEKNKFSLERVENKDLRNGTLILTQNVQVIGGHAFYGCRELTHIKIPSSVTYIRYAPFRTCINLTELTIPSTIKRNDVCSDFIRNCRNLRILNIPPQLAYHEGTAFPFNPDYFPALEKININASKAQILRMREDENIDRTTRSKLYQNPIFEKSLEIQNTWLLTLINMPQKSSFYARTLVDSSIFGGKTFDFTKLPNDLKAYINSFLDNECNPIFVKARSVIEKLSLPSYEEELEAYSNKIIAIVEYYQAVASDILKYQDHQNSKHGFFATLNKELPDIHGRKRSSSITREDAPLKRARNYEDYVFASPGNKR